MCIKSRRKEAREGQEIDLDTKRSTSARAAEVLAKGGRNPDLGMLGLMYGEGREPPQVRRRGIAVTISESSDRVH